MTGGFSPQWLALREPADAAARASALLEPLVAALPADRPVVVRDLGCGTGSMGRWLAPLLPGPQHWILSDRAVDLLDRALDALPGHAADGAAVTAVTEVAEVGRLTAADLASTACVTASALLDLLAEDELDALVAACVTASCPALLTLTVAGRVTLDPPHPLDAALEAAFNAHQRRRVDGRQLLGPVAAAATRDRFHRAGVAVYLRDSPWRLGPAAPELLEQWLRGWVAAATEQRPELASEARDYLLRRSAECAAGSLRAVVSHVDLLALPTRAEGR